MDEETSEIIDVPVFQAEFTDEEIESMRLADIEMQRQQEEIESKITAKESALKKLSKLGLTELEARTVVGID